MPLPSIPSAWIICLTAFTIIHTASATQAINHDETAPIPPSTPSPLPLTLPVLITILLSNLLTLAITLLIVYSYFRPDDKRKSRCTRGMMSVIICIVLLMIWIITHWYWSDGIIHAMNASPQHHEMHHAFITPMITDNNQTISSTPTPTSPTTLPPTSAPHIVPNTTTTTTATTTTTTCPTSTSPSSSSPSASHRPPSMHITMATGKRPFRHYPGFQPFVAYKTYYTFLNQTYPRQCSGFNSTCQMQDWIKMLTLVSELPLWSQSTKPAPYVWILEDDCYPCPGAGELLGDIMAETDETMVNTGIGGSGWAMRLNMVQKLLNILKTHVTLGPDLAVVEHFNPLPTRLAVNLIAHSTLQASVLNHGHGDTGNDPENRTRPIYASCFEYQMVAGWNDYDLFDWNRCAGYDMYPCNSKTSKILAERNIGYVGNTFYHGKFNVPALYEWPIRSYNEGQPPYKASPKRRLLESHDESQQTSHHDSINTTSRKASAIDEEFINDGVVLTPRV